MNKEKVSMFIVIAFLVSWAVSTMIHLLGINFNSIQATLLIATLYMSAPALATIVIQKFIFKETLRAYGFTVKGIQWKHMLTAIAFYLSFIGFSLLIIFLLGNMLGVEAFGQLSFSMEEHLRNLNKLNTSGNSIEELPTEPFLFFLGILMSVVGGFTLNILFMLGEELGWRGLLLKETQPLGFWKSNILIGIIWGLWHMPLILMGHNYGIHKLGGIFMMILFCIAMSFLHAIIRIKTESVFGSSALHGMINAGGRFFILYIIHSNELIGSLAGMAGVVAALITTVVYLMSDKKFIAGYSRW